MPIEAPPTTDTDPGGGGGGNPDGGGTAAIGTGFATTMRIVDQAGTQLLASGAFTPIILNSLELGYPDIRASAQPIAGAHGTFDTTRFMGARTVTAEVTLPQGPAADPAEDVLKRCMNPGLRLWLYAQRPGWTAERRILIRGGPYTCAPGTVRQAQMVFTAPSGLLEDALPTTLTLTPSGSATGGFTFPISFPLTIGSGLISGAALVDVGGDIEVPPVIDIYGPCSNPLVRCVDTGAQIRFNMTISDTDFLRVDMGARTANLNGDPNQPRFSQLDFASSSWWSLPVGPDVQVVFSPTSPSGGCKAVLSFRPRWL